MPADGEVKIALVSSKASVMHKKSSNAKRWSIAEELIYAAVVSARRLEVLKS